jgi:hypothetical protein
MPAFRIKDYRKQADVWLNDLCQNYTALWVGSWLMNSEVSVQDFLAPCFWVYG